MTHRADPEGFDAFVAATGHRMHRAALLLCGGDHHLAEDLTQATYTKVFVAWGKVRRAEDPVAYTRRVLTRTYLSHRRLRRSSERPTDLLPDAVQAATGDGAVRLDLMRALGLLSAQDRAVLVLRYWLDLDVAQTAEILGVGESAVRQRARRALTRLRVHVPDLDPDDGTGDTTDQEQR
ncbi:MAG: SigE family RNA polymerase sigma factor [Nocardioidaceae bacterium]